MHYETKADPLDAVFAVQGKLAPAPLRPVLSGGAAIADPVRCAFVDGFLRQGRAVELKSVSGALDADGGYAVPREIDAIIDATLKAASPIRAIANVVQVGSAGYRKLVTQQGVASGWASETAARPETGTPVFTEIVPTFGDLYANPAATQAMLDDAQFDVEQWLAGEIAAEFAKAEGSAFVRGDGFDKPTGFLRSPIDMAGDGYRPFGTLQYVPSGADGGFDPVAPEDRLVEMVHALRAPYRQGAVWVLNSATLATIRKFKTADGHRRAKYGLRLHRCHPPTSLPPGRSARCPAGRSQYGVVTAWRSGRVCCGRIASLPCAASSPTRAIPQGSN